VARTLQAEHRVQGPECEGSIAGDTRDHREWKKKLEAEAIEGELSEGGGG